MRHEGGLSAVGKGKGGTGLAPKRVRPKNTVGNSSQRKGGVTGIL